MRDLTRLLLGAALLAGFSVEADAAPLVCGGHDSFASYLNDVHQEHLQSIGLTDGGLLLEVFVSPGGTWTILMTTPEGLACLLASGQSWESLPPATPEVAS